MEIISVLEDLARCHSPSGEETAIAEKLRDYAAPFVDECRTDAMGNLFVRKHGPGAKLMVCAHMDSIGLIVTRIEDSGFLRFGVVGGVEAADLLHIPVRFRSGLQGVVSADESVLSENKPLSVSRMYIDIGASCREEAEKMVSPGDTAVYVGRIFTIGDRLVAPYLDNHVSCALLLYVLSGLKNGGNDITLVFSAQEEVGMRGAAAAAYTAAPDYAVAVDVTDCGDLPGSAHLCTAELGKGAAVKVMDHSVICQPKMVAFLERLAQAGRIPCQRDILSDGGTDTGPICKSRGGVLTGGISVPCRYSHSPAEMVSMADVKACAELLKAFLEFDYKAGI